jgi:hypothetical protein
MALYDTLADYLRNTSFLAVANVFLFASTFATKAKK